MTRKFLLTITALLCVTTSRASAVAGDKPFSVLHISDVHISPHLAKEPQPGEVRGQDTFDWLYGEVDKPQEIPGWPSAAPKPDFAIVTGDITEYGVIDDTWDIVKRTFDRLPFPWHALPGNHDNTWVALYDVMRRRHGGENHSIDHKGVHFVFLCSASPQEPVPSIDATTRAWLQADLAKVDARTPIIVAMHHPLEIDEFANPVEQVTLVDMLRDHNVQLMLFGHGHSLRRHDEQGIPGVQGGSTFGGNSGYGVITIGDGRIRYAYHFLKKKLSDDPEAQPGGWKTVYDEPLAWRPRLFDLQSPEKNATVTGSTLHVRATPTNDASGKTARVTYAIDDGSETGEREVQLNDAFDIDVPLDGLQAGAHLLTVHLRIGEGKDAAHDLRTRIFHTADPRLDVVWRRNLPAAMKAGPLIAGDLLILPRTDGILQAVNRKTGENIWQLKSDGEILATPAISGDTIVFGSGDGGVYGADLRGAIRWKYTVGIPVYSQPVIADGVVYIGDNGGNMHAISVADGTHKWSFARADFSIECQPAVWGDMLVFGAWDGFLYALDRNTGELRWKQPGPKASLGKGVRYYAPADCGPIVAGDRLVVCDRGYHLGTYAPDGKMLTNDALDVSAVTASADHLAYFARHRDDRVRKSDTNGTTLWETQVPAGRFPVPPTLHGDTLYVCANTGLLSALNAQTGEKLWSYRTTPGFYVMGSVAVADDGICYVAGMDGSLTAIRPRTQQRG
ncbi:MAG: PQQ-binding-like beta-propeller repeat protein [Phycisphaerales bacterium]|nr:PQQ-binding-like beta-propeller repeat protein [Phycisphaerales bacterium]